jgi:hypothetical protein
MHFKGFFCHGPRFVERLPGADATGKVRLAAIAQDLHHALHVVSQDVQRHFGADVLQGLHLEVG